MKPIELGRMRIHKVHEMDSPVPLLSQLPGTTADDMQDCFFDLVGKNVRHVGHDEPGRDSVDRDPATGQFARQCFRQANQAGLACRVVRLPRIAR